MRRFRGVFRLGECGSEIECRSAGQRRHSVSCTYSAERWASDHRGMPSPRVPPFLRPSFRLFFSFRPHSPLSRSAARPSFLIIGLRGRGSRTGRSHKLKRVPHSTPLCSHHSLHSSSSPFPRPGYAPGARQGDRMRRAAGGSRSGARRAGCGTERARPRPQRRARHASGPAFSHP